MSYLDVFKDFEYEDEVDDTFSYSQDPSLQDTFSQILNEPSTSQPLTTPPSPKKPQSKRVKESVIDEDPRANLSDYEEAFTVLKSIEEAHKPFSYTAINAYIHYKRGIHSNKRSAKGVLWPEHFESFKDSRLISEKDDDNEAPVKLCEISNSEQFQESLKKACQSIWLQKAPPSAILDPLLADSIAQRTAFLLQAVFDRSVQNRKSAISLFKKFPQTKNVDVDNVPVDWKSTREAARQLIGQAALDPQIFKSFSDRLDNLFADNDSKL